VEQDGETLSRMEFMSGYVLPAALSMPHWSTGVMAGRRLNGLVAQV